MNYSVTFIFVFILIYIVSSRDFYVGMLKKNDLLVAQDRLYKDRVPYRTMYAKYGRVFKCKITYFKVVDRLGFGPGPRVQIVRGGLNHKYLVLRFTSPYNMPISVNIYVGCPNVARDHKTDVPTTIASTTVNVTSIDSNSTATGNSTANVATTAPASSNATNATSS